MGTHPIFEPDFDCLTETELFERWTALAHDVRRRVTEILN